VYVFQLIKFVYFRCYRIFLLNKDIHSAIGTLQSNRERRLTFRRYIDASWRVSYVMQMK